MGMTEKYWNMSRPPEVPIKTGEETSLLEQIPGLTKDDLGIRQVEALLSFKNEELAFLNDHQYSYFILGSYDKVPKRRLNLVCQRLNQKPNTTAQTLIKLRNFDELPDIDEDHVEDLPQTLCQFHLVARNIDAILTIAEDRNAGSSVELGQLIPASGQQPDEHPYFQCTYALPRNYDQLTQADIHADHNVNIDNPYSQPQRDLFDVFNTHGRCHWWTERTNLMKIVDDIHNQITGI